MRILIVAATIFEIDKSLTGNKDIEVLISGVSAPVTMYHLTKKLLQDTYGLVIQAGIAGSFSGKIKKEEVVLVKQDAFADVGVEVKREFKTIFKLGLADENRFPFSDGWLVNDNQILKTTHLKVVSAVTVNKLSDRKKQTLQLKKIFNPDIESMEGAALHYACLNLKVPFLQMRSISNKVAERDKTKWKIKEAIKALNTELIKLIKTLPCT
jgi:futalosine hydrolase